MFERGDVRREQRVVFFFFLCRCSMEREVENARTEGEGGR